MDAEILNYIWLAFAGLVGFIFKWLWDLNRKMDSKATIQEVDKQMASLKADIVHIGDMVNGTAKDTDAKLNQLMLSLLEKK